MDRRSKSRGITVSDLNNALAEARSRKPTQDSYHYWRIKRQLEYEHSQKIIKGQELARAEGKRIGRPPVTSFGEQIDKMRQRGMTWKEIGTRMNRPTSTVFRRFAMYLKQKGLDAAGRYRVK